MSLIIKVELRRRNVVAATPLEDLLFAMLGSSLSLVKTLESTIGSLVETPRLVMRDPEGAHFLANLIIGLDGTCQYGSVSKIEFKTVLLEKLTGLLSLLNTLWGKVNIVPASETV